MEQITPKKFVDKFLEAGEVYGLCNVFDATFGGRLLRDEDNNGFVWFSDQEYDSIIAEATKPAHLIQAHRSICDDE